MVYGKVETVDTDTRITSESSNIKMSKIRMIKNIIVVCTAVFILFLSYTGLQMLQSTINKEEGVGVASQAIVFAFTALSSLLLPEYFIKRYGSKTIFAAAITLYLPYILANFYPDWIVMVPAAILNGIGASFLWSASGAYLNDLSVMLAEHNFSTEDLEKEIPKLLPNFSIITGEISDDNGDDEEMYTIPETFVYITGRKRTFSDISFSKSRRQSARASFSRRRNSLADAVQFTTRRSSVGNANFHETFQNEIQTFDEKDEIEESSSMCSQQHSNSEGQKDYHITFSECKPQVISKIGLNADLADLQNTNEDLQNTNEDLQNTNSENLLNPYLICKKIYIEAVTSRVFGIFGMAFLSTIFWSNLVSFFIIGDTDFSHDAVNFTCSCGAKYCHGASVCLNETFEANITDAKRYILFSVSALLAVAALVFIYFLLDPLTIELEKVPFTLKRLLSTISFSKKLDAVLLLLFTLNTGMSIGFFLGDFTQAYISCAFGIYHVTLASSCYGLSCAISSVISGWLVKYSDRKRVFSVGFVLNIVTNITLMFWETKPSHLKMLYIISAIFGVHIGIVWSQTRALYGIFFKEDQEAAFSAYYVWYAFGFSLSLAVSGYFCIFEKLFVLLIMSVLGFVGYVIVEKRHKNKYFRN